MKLIDWVKKLGQWHLAENNSSVTLCGMAMLGNNYDRMIATGDREKCDECFRKAKEVSRGKGLGQLDQDGESP